ncbi:hypothetical protein OSTOST_01558 [Ostertagia ostertagi]
MLKSTSLLGASTQIFQRVPSIHPIHEELRSGCAINVHGRSKLGKNFGVFVVELLSRSSTIMSLEFNAKTGEVKAISRTDGKMDKEIEMNGHFVGCFVPTGDVRSVEAIGIKGDVHVNIMTIEGFPFLKS